MAKMARPMTGREVFANLFVKGEEADCVSLQIKNICEGRGQGCGILRFGVAERAKAHRTAVVREQVATKIGFVFEFFDEVPIAARKHAPIDVTGIIAGSILPIFGEFDGKAVIWAAM